MGSLDDLKKKMSAKQGGQAPKAKAPSFGGAKSSHSAPKIHSAPKSPASHSAPKSNPFSAMASHPTKSKSSVSKSQGVTSSKSGLFDDIKKPHHGGPDSSRVISKGNAVHSPFSGSKSAMASKSRPEASISHSAPSISNSDKIEQKRHETLKKHNIERQREAAAQQHAAPSFGHGAAAASAPVAAATHIGSSGSKPHMSVEEKRRAILEKHHAEVNAKKSVMGERQRDEKVAAFMERAAESSYNDQSAPVYYESGSSSSSSSDGVGTAAKIIGGVVAASAVAAGATYIARKLNENGEEIYDETSPYDGSEVFEESYAGELYPEEETYEESIEEEAPVEEAVDPNSALATGICPCCCAPVNRNETECEYCGVPYS